MGVSLPAGKGVLDAVEVPVPPSTNNLFATVGKRRVPTSEYRKWRKLAEPLVSGLRVPDRFPCVVTLRLRGKVHASRDLANIEKAVGDELVRCGVIPDDRLAYVRGVCMWYEPDDGEARVRIELTGAE